jgi:hypothetical protein
MKNYRRRGDDRSAFDHWTHGGGDPADRDAAGRVDQENTVTPIVDIAVNLGNLSGPDGNAYVILGRVSKMLDEAGHGDLVETFHAEATSGNYEHLLKTCKKYVKARWTK